MAAHRDSSSGIGASKRAYSPPVLEVFGAVRDLTAGGSGKSGEVGKGNKNRKP